MKGGIEERARAAYLGFAVGDALGATTEFLTPREIAARHGVHKNMIGGGWLRLKAGRVTDDTGMALALGDALLEAKGFDAATAADHFVRWMRSKPVDVGDTVRRGLSGYISEGRLVAERSGRAAGNGAAMRNLPVIIATLSGAAAFEEWTIGQARITHNNEESAAGTLMLGSLTRAAILEGQAAPLQSIARGWIERRGQFDHRRYKGEAGGYIVETVRTVLHFFFNTYDFEPLLVGVVNQGGDADTNAALAGQLGGAFYGPDSIPSRWLRKLDGGVKERIERQVEDLLSAFPIQHLP